MAVPAYVVVWLVIVYAWVANYFVRIGLSALLPPVMEELGLSYAKAGFLSSALFYSYVAMQVPAGMLGDRFGRKRLLLVGLVVSATASGLTGLVGSFGALLAARFLTGLGQGCLFSNDRVIIAATTPRERIALGLGLSFSGPGVGTTLGLVLAGLLGTLLPWRSVFLVLTVPVVTAALLVWRLVPEPPTGPTASDPSWPFRRVLRTRDFWLLSTSGLVPVAVQFLLATWAPLLFTELGVRDLARSAALASLQGIVSPPGLILSGVLADRLARRGIPRQRVGASALALMSLAVAAMAWVIGAHGPAWLLAALMLAASLFMWGSWSPAYALLAETFPPGVLGRAFGAYNMVCMTGAIISPYASGAVRDWTGSFVPALVGAAALAWVSIGLVLAVRTGRGPAAAPTGP